jgi:hypothetical protein
VITAEFKGEKTSKKIVTIGGKSAEKSMDAYLARTSGLEVTFSIPTRIVDDILKFISPSPAVQAKP